MHSIKLDFIFFPLGQTFSTGLHKTAQGYQEEGVIKLLKDIRDGLASVIAPRGPGLDDPNNDDPNNDDSPDDNNMPDLETEEAAERISTNALNKIKNNIEIEISNLDKIVKNKENELSTKLNKLNNDFKKYIIILKKIMVK